MPRKFLDNSNMQTNPEDAFKVENKLKFWSKELQDMSGRNRLLFYKDTKSSTASIEVPAFASLFDLLVEKGTELYAPLSEPEEVKSLFDDYQDNAKDKESITQKAHKKLKENEIQTNHTISVLNKVDCTPKTGMTKGISFRRMLL